jgi:tRNA(fMet)-specific endonuclease VapC
MLDTNICNYLIKQKPLQVIGRLAETPLSDVGISSITLCELELGVCKSGRPEQNRAALIEFLSPLEILPFDDIAAQSYGEIRSFLESKGTLMGSLDTLVASHACSIPCKLVTNNSAEFSRVPQLQLENWLD